MPRERLRTLFLEGVAVVVPVVISVWILVRLAAFVGSFLGPVVGLLRQLGVQSDVRVALLQVASLGLVCLVTLLVGAAVHVQVGRQLVDRVEGLLSSIPGFGTIYQTTRRMSDLIIDPDEEGGSRFSEVKLVEFPGQETYTLGFLTTRTPPDGVVTSAREITGEADGEYHTLFLPMAPNPFMGGHLTHVPADRVHDVDIGVEEAVQYILTTGVVDNPGET